MPLSVKQESDLQNFFECADGTWFTACAPKLWDKGLLLLNEGGVQSFWTAKAWRVYLFLSAPGWFFERLWSTDHPSQRLSDLRIVGPECIALGGRVLERIFSAIHTPTSPVSTNPEVISFIKELAERMLLVYAAAP